MKIHTPKLIGFAVLFKNGQVEYWKYDPSLLNKKQLKALDIEGFKKFAVSVN